ncbi:carcinoembryonic antigen-related cell adhesion molecule 2 [Microtus ochrogaster]|uniref:Carcinoembryonic antigen-related cell adhesion molecule 2 n=1 Tax=Microtus ochrogaster TaxID=79684 RepID=A0ABM1UJL5_MICOH|nr:carcinoembryonic antigen-related cell adhesion molecule 2 [Microtus ochrogaster]
MELSSAPLHKGQLPWFSSSLLASLLIYWSSPTTAQVTVEAVPPHVAEGANILLLVHNLPETPQVFYWHKGENPDNSNEIAHFIVSANINTSGPAHSGRETIYPNGSLLFQNVTQKDTGAYTLQMLMQSYDTMKASVQFHVHQLVTTPSIQVSNSIVKEFDSVSLSCFSNDTGISIHWIFNGQNLRLTHRMKLHWTNKILRIFPVKREDTGKYQCEVSNPVSSKRSDPIQLDIIDLGSSDNSPNEVDHVVYTVLNINSQTHKLQSSRATETVYSEVQKK